MSVRPSIGAMRALVAFLLPHLVWRHHGIGVLQAYVRENIEPEVRVHIWHPSLVREGIVDQGDAHDHRFDLESTVLTGRLFETLYCPEAGAPRRFDAWHVENARSAGVDRGFDGDCRPIETDLGMWTQWRVHESGSTYTLERGHFHRTSVDALAVTICSMHEKRGQARLLVPAGTEPVHAFGAHSIETQASGDRVRSVVAEAIAALRAEADSARGGA